MPTTQQPTPTPRPMGAEEAEFIAVAQRGDAAAFALLTERYRREIHVHCYRMLASYTDAEDMVQEAFTRAWARRDTFAGRASLRAWLYRIATNACLNLLSRRRDRVATPAEDEGPGDVVWLQPYPDHLLPAPDAPEDVVISRETIELAFVVAVQHLPPRQRAVLVLRDVLGWPARATAEALELTVPATNSALQRARETMRRYLPDRRADWQAPRPGSLDEVERRMVEAYAAAHAANDIEGLRALLAEDLRFSMPPNPGVWTDRRSAVQSWVDGGFGSADFGDMRCQVTTVNAQPAVMVYLRQDGQDAFHPFAIDVLRLDEAGLVAEIIGFEVHHADLDYGLPASLPV